MPQTSKKNKRMTADSRPWMTALVAHWASACMAFGLVGTALTPACAALTLGYGPLAFAEEAPASAPSPPPPSGAKPAAPAPAEASKAPSAEPDHVQVQHILIGFEGSVPGKAIKRSRDEAKGLAGMILGRAKKPGVDFGDLVKEYTNDAFPGIYNMSNLGVPKAPGEYQRNEMMKGFGDVAFSLKVGEIGMAEYSPASSRYGWHIIKRLK